MPPLKKIESLQLWLTEANQKLIYFKDIDESLLQETVANALESKKFFQQDSKNLSVEWKRFSTYIASYLSLPVHSLVYRQIKSINAYISSQSFFPSAPCEVCGDMVQSIISQLNGYATSYKF